MKTAYGPIKAPARCDTPAPVAGLTRGQCRALVTLFFAAEMDRERAWFVADGFEPVTGKTIEVFHARGLARLLVERSRNPERPKIITYRYYVKLTDRGEWYATTLIRQREMLVSALSPQVAPDDFEESRNVYAQEQEAEGVE